MSEQKIFAFDGTVLNEFQACARKGQFSHVMNLRTVEKPTAMDMGGMLHDMLACYRTLLKLTWRGGDANSLTAGELSFLKEYEVVPGNYRWKDIVDASVMVGRGYASISDLMPEDAEITINNFIEYADYYQNDGWQPIEVEASFSQLLFESPELILIYEGRIDLITDSRAGRTVVDSKSSKRRQIPGLLSNQFIGYAWATDTASVTVDKIGFQKTLKPKERFQRHILSYPQALKDEWKEWAIYWGKIIVFQVENGIFPPNFTSCDKYGGCVYNSVCSTTPGARDWKAATLFRKGEPWSPQSKELVSVKSESEESDG